MESNEIAANIIKIFKNEKDEILRMLTILKLLTVETQNLASVTESYLKIKSGQIKIIEVKSSIELNAKQKKDLQNKISKSIEIESVFLFTIDSKVKGIEVYVGDSLVNLNTGWY